MLARCRNHIILCVQRRRRLTMWILLTAAVATAWLVGVSRALAFAPATTQRSSSSVVQARGGCCQQEQYVDSESIPLLATDRLDLLSRLVNERARARSCGNYGRADVLRDEIHSVELPEGICVVLEDVPRKEGGGSVWRLARNDTAVVESLIEEGPTVLQLAHAALGLAAAAAASSSSSSSVDKDELEELVCCAKERLNKGAGAAVELELSGRKAADAAFWFALAGVTDEVLFKSLAAIAAKELGRFGKRSSCRAKDIWQILDRMAAAGNMKDATLTRIASEALAAKGILHTSDMSSMLDFCSDRCLMLLWKFSTRQRKQRAFLRSAVAHWKQHRYKISGASTYAETESHSLKCWNDALTDPRRPLVMDIGCGMGVSLLGLSQLEGKWSEFNFVGVDRSGLAIGYARGLAKRWGVENRTQFVVGDAEGFVQQVVASYPGPVELCMIQFPTPYRLSKPESSIHHSGGNSQLPWNETTGFMVTETLLRSIHGVLRSEKWPNVGKLLLQSNCEDVAVWMMQTACRGANFGAETFPNSGETNLTLQTRRVPKRTLDWLAMGGQRAQGDEWSQIALLPRGGRTETEVACALNGVPVHRCLLVPKAK